MAKVALANSFIELDDSIKEEEYKKSVEICDKILSSVPEGDKDVATCKIIALIHLSQFEKALNLLQEFPNELQFERAYCYYKLSQFEKAQEVLEKTEKTSRVEQLLAQLYYRLGRYEDSISIYNKTIKENSELFEPKVNLLANYASCDLELTKDLKNNENSPYEYYYNLACCAIYRGDLTLASNLLDLAEKRCEDLFRSQNYSDEEIKDELAIIKVQKGYLHQLKGSPQLSLDLYNSVLESKVSDVSVSAIAMNNLVSVKKDQKLFSAEKKLQNAIHPPNDLKLTPLQRNIILFNRAVCQLKMNKLDTCKDFIKQIDGNDDGKAILHSAVLIKEKKNEEAISLLEKSSSLNQRLCYAQWLFQETKYDDCLNVLQSLSANDLHRPAIVAFRTFLYQYLRNYEKANEVFDHAIEHWTKNKKDIDVLIKILKPAADYKMKNKQFESASQLYKLLIEYDNENVKSYVPLLIICLSHFNPTAAEEYAESIPSVQYEQILNAEELESNFRTKIHDNNNVNNTENEIEVSADVKLVERKKKKKKKKKSRIPKNFNPNVVPDPERWLPRKERSNFKRRKNTKKPARGAHQGADSSAGPVKVEDKPAVVVQQKQVPNKKAKKGRRK